MKTQRESEGGKRNRDERWRSQEEIVLMGDNSCDSKISELEILLAGRSSGLGRLLVSTQNPTPPALTAKLEEYTVATRSICRVRTPFRNLL
jgi:hypothetical protein